MPLTPEDVSNKRFTPVRLREGYDMGEVDQFLDEVEAELARLIQENDDLRAKLDAATHGGSGAYMAPRAVQAEPEPAPEPEPTPEPEPAPIAPIAATPVAAPQEIRVTNVAEASSAAARLLEIAGRNADEVVESAKSDADRIIGEARTKAERLESDARTRSQMLDSETAEKRQQLLGDLEKEKVRLNGEIETLRTFEREYRSRLKSYFTQQLAALETNPGDSAGASHSYGSTEAPKRLKSLLGEDDNN